MPVAVETSEAPGWAGAAVAAVRSARRRRQWCGPNALRSHRARPAALLLRQFANPLLLLLLMAAAVSVFLGEGTDAGIIVTIVALSVGLSFVNEYRSERAVEALHTAVRHEAVVRRDGVARTVDVTELTPPPGLPALPKAGPDEHDASVTDDETGVIPLPGGRTLTVRSATREDVDELTRMYESLSADHRYRRFFSVAQPLRRASSGWWTPPPPEVSGSWPSPEQWRGWLGPFLLDVLAHRAAAHGVHNLRATVPDKIVLDFPADDPRQAQLAAAHEAAGLDVPVVTDDDARGDEPR